MPISQVAKMLHMIKSNHIYITLTSFHTIHIPWNDNGDRSLNLGLGKKKKKKPFQIFIQIPRYGIVT